VHSAITVPYYLCAYVPLLLSQYRHENTWADMEVGDDQSRFCEPMMSKATATKDFSVEIR
jgi:hypothetical protein